MRVPGEVIKFIEKEKTFLIAAHINPDGDTLGSSLALSFALESLGKKSVLYSRDPVPELYRFLPGRERFTNSLPHERLPLFLIDCNGPERADLGDSDFSSSAVIDHHETLSSFGDVKWIEPFSAATGVMIYYLVKGLGVTITKDIADNLYAAIAIDTGTFRYSNTSSEVLRIGADLIDSGAEPAGISEALYESWSDRRFTLLIRMLNTLEVVEGIAVTYVSKEMFRQTGTSAEDTEHFSNFPRMLASVRVAAFFREIDEGWKVSLRSKGDFDVAKIAEMFDGGGHRNAAGYTIKADRETAREALLKALTGH